MAMYSSLMVGGFPPKNPGHQENSHIQNVGVFGMDMLLRKDL